MTERQSLRQLFYVQSREEEDVWKKPKKEKEKEKERKTFDPAVYRPVLKCSICNGEQVAGFKNLRTGKFEEVAFIRERGDLEAFLNLYGLENIEKEY